MSRIELRGSVSRVPGSKTSGRLEVLDPGGKSENVDSSSKATIFRKTCTSKSSAVVTKHTDLRNGKLEVLGPTDRVIIPSVAESPRPGCASGRLGSAGRKSYTPTKQISLCTVKPITPSNGIPDYCARDHLSSKMDTGPLQKENMPENTGKKSSMEVQTASHHRCEMTNQLEESSSDEEESDNEKQSAPIELLAEFIKAVMDAEYKLAWKLCQMILIYEPENVEAKQFSPLIQKMLQNDEDQDSDEEDSEDTDEDEDQDSSDTDDSEESSSDTSDSSSQPSTLEQQLYLSESVSARLFTFINLFLHPSNVICHAVPLSHAGHTAMHK